MYARGNALIRKDGEYPLFDGLGSERTVTNSSQTVTGTITFEGFGQAVATTGSSTDPYMFAATSGYRNDGDAGLMHVGARYYDAQVGRFITRDTNLSQHPYAYCAHDPANRVDPSGHEWRWWTAFKQWIGWEDPPKPTFQDPGKGGDIKYTYPDGSKRYDLGPFPRPPADGGASPGSGAGGGGIGPGEGGEGGEGGIGGGEGGFGGGCFVAGTPVLMPDGTSKPIEQIHVGDHVLSKNLVTGRTEPQRVERVFVRTVVEGVLLRLRSGETIDTTKKHLFYVLGTGFLYAAGLKPGMQILTATGAPAFVESAELVPTKRHKVYNLRVSVFHNFFVGKATMLVHNTFEGYDVYSDTE